MDIVGVAEIANILGVTRQRVHQLAETPDFPEPAAVLTAGKIWERATIMNWADKTGRRLPTATQQTGTP